MIKFNKLIILIATMAILVSCKKKSDISPDPNPEPEKPATYSKLSPEEHKSKLETAGRDFTKQMEELRDAKAASAINSLLSLPLSFYDNVDLFSSVVAKSGAKQINNKANLISIDASLQNTHALNSAFGIYTWNTKKGDWDKTAATDMLQVKFPSTKGGALNDAVMTMTYKKSGATFTQGSDTYELPASVNAKLVVDGTATPILELTSEFTYDSNNNVATQKTALTTGNYVLKNSLTNNTKDLGIEFSFEKSGKALLKGVLNTNGIFSHKEIDKAISTYSEADLFNNANIKLQLMNIQFVGVADFTGLRAADKTVPDNGTEEDKAKLKVVNKNKFINMYATYTEDNTIIAKSNFFVKKQSYDTWVYDPVTQQGTVKKFFYYDQPLRLLFKDDTAIETDVYIGSGFQKLIDELDKFTNKFN